MLSPNLYSLCESSKSSVASNAYELHGFKISVYKFSSNVKATLFNSMFDFITQICVGVDCATLKSTWLWGYGKISVSLNC